MGIRRDVLILATVFFLGGQTGFAQVVLNGVGDATTINTPFKTYSSTGNANAIGDFSHRSSGQNTGEYFTRHLRSGDSSGIGGSFLGTTNVTAESSPARAGSSPARTGLQTEQAAGFFIPKAEIDQFQTHLFSNLMTNPVNNPLPELSPSAFAVRASVLPIYDKIQSIDSIDFPAGRENRPAFKPSSTNMSAPSFDSF
jgi:hypothetical protein